MDPLTASLDNRFRRTTEMSLRLLKLLPAEFLFRQPRPLDKTFAVFTVGECLIRCSAVVEQTIGGLTRRLWDDPFEWTLPEELQTHSKVREYINEVEAARVKGFEFLAGDGDLGRTISAPSGMLTIFDLLADTLARSSHFQGRAFAVFQVFSDEKLPSI